jgi:hypothetical protein
MGNKLFPKVTEIKGDAASVTTPEFSLAENSALVFLIGTTGNPLTVTAKGFKGDTGKDIKFVAKKLTDDRWEEVDDDGLKTDGTFAFLAAIPADFLAHDELDRVALTVDGDTDGKAIFAFEFGGRYIPE